MGRHRIQWRNYKFTDTYYIKKPYHTVANHYQQNPSGRIHQPIKSHPHKIQHAV